MPQERRSSQRKDSWKKQGQLQLAVGWRSWPRRKKNGACEKAADAQDPVPHTGEGNASAARTTKRDSGTVAAELGPSSCSFQLDPGHIAGADMLTAAASL